MASPSSPAETRAYIVERLVGEIGEPDHVVDSARAVAERAVPAIVEGLKEAFAAPFGVELKGVEIARFSEAKPSDATGSAMTVASSVSSPDALTLLLDPGAIAVAVAMLFGGDPDLVVAPISRDLSPTEIEVASLLFQEVAKAINTAVQSAFEIRFPVPPAMSGDEIRKHIVRDGPAVRIVFSVHTAAASGKLTVLVPQRLLIKQRGDPAAAAAPDNEWRAKFNDEVMRSSVQLEATMPLATMTLGDLSALQAGQIIELDAGAQGEARLSSRNKTLFVCEFGKLGQNYTVRIRHPFDAGQEFIDGLLPA